MKKIVKKFKKILKKFKFILPFLLLVALIVAILLFTQRENKNSVQQKYTENFNEIRPENVHIFMSFDDEYGENIGNNCAKINSLYAEKYNYKFHKEDRDTGDLPPHYKRYFFARDLMSKYPDNDYFVYLDGDAALIQHDIDIRKWFPYKDSDNFVLLGNEMFRNYDITLRTIIYGMSPNSGVMIIKNNKWTRNFMNNVIENGHKKKGIDKLDQGCIEEMYKLNNDNEKTHLKVISYKNPIQHHKGYMKNGLPNIRKEGVPILHTVGLNTLTGILYNNKNEQNFLKNIEPVLKPI